MVPLEGTISFEELTAKVEALNDNLPIGVLNLRRLLRHAMTFRVFREPSKGQVAHTRTSRLLLEDEPLKNWVGFMGHDVWLPLANVVGAMRKWPASDEPTETGVNLAYNQNLPWFDFIQQNKGLANRYNLAMQAHGGSAGYAAEHVVTGYEWGNLGKATVVDVRFCPFSPLYEVKLTVFRWAGTRVIYHSPSRRPFQTSRSSFKTRLGCGRQRPSALFRLTLPIV